MAVAARQAMSTPAGLGAVLALPEAAGTPPVVPPPVPAPAPVPAPTAPDGKDRRAGRRRLATLVLPVVLVTGGGVTAQQFDLLPWQDRSTRTTADPTRSPDAPGASPATATPAPSGTEQAAPTPPTASSATPSGSDPAPPATDPDQATGPGGTSAGTGAGTGTGTGSGGSSGGNGSSSGGSSGSNSSSGGGTNSSGGSTPAPPKQPTTTAPTTPSGPAAGCGGTGWGRLVNTGSGRTIGLGSDTVSAGVPVVSGGHTAYGWIKAASNGSTTFTACKASSGISLGARYAGSPSVAELAGPSSYADMTNWYPSADSGNFQLKFGFGPQGCLTDNGSGNTLTVTTCNTNDRSQLFHFS
ncbi:hypothetical protein [Kitasatospora phosalacinea]|uniref:Uncharacterized protein n=1 Tax=Kitasatospora phosalacinea TaxID=2065 RepID=A0A9W6PPQ8_9ACTN|nr:hypothetical protein [Kitasatospora phosalacinea]GLW58967.1 hypothetical protein Kpho01_69770 [Kitasatospora phosalacinea]